MTTHRSTPAFAIGGVAWLDHMGNPGDASIVPPGGWRCYHCNEHYTDPVAAARHFGEPGSKDVAQCVEAAEIAQTGTVYDIPDYELVRRAARGARARQAGYFPRWVGIASTFGLGSTYATQLAVRFELDPEEKVRR